MIRFNWKGVLGTAMATSLFLSGCGIFTGTGTSSGGETLSDNQILRITESRDIPTLDSAKAADVASFNILNNVEEGLFRPGKDRQPEKGIAYDYTVSKDKKTYTFKLRDDAKWSDGKPVTAYDFEYAWKRALDPATKSQYAYILFPILNAEKYNAGKAKASDVGVKAKDDHTLVVKLEHPMFNFIDLTTLATYLPQRKDVVEKYKDQYGTKVDTLVFDGPFIVTNWNLQKMVLEKNDQYWDRNAVSLKEVDINIVKDTATGINMYNAGQVDVASLNQAFVDAFKQTNDFVKVEEASTYFIVFNQKDPFFSNDKIRKAISLALDREQIADKIMKDGSKPAGSLVPPTLTGVGTESFRKNGEVVQRNVSQARDLFRQGLAELGMSKPPTNIVMIGYDTTAKKDVAVNIKEQLRTTLGLDIKLDAPSWKVHLDRVNRGNFMMAMMGWGADYNDPVNFFEIFESKNPLNWAKFNNPQYDQLVETAKRETNQAKAYQDLSRAEKILVGTDGDGQAAIAPLFYGGKALVQKPYVKDLYRHSYGAEYSLKWAYIVKEKK
jgi:oligopeptide transport system substrate-binding protein